MPVASGQKENPTATNLAEENHAISSKEIAPYTKPDQKYAKPTSVLGSKVFSPKTSNQKNQKSSYQSKTGAKVNFSELSKLVKKWMIMSL